MGQGVPWTFEQLEGARRKIELSGWNAPHGRPRQGAVVRPAVAVRASRTRYPGGDGSAVTRHVFGPDFPDLEIKGRFRRGQVQNLMTNMSAFVAEAQPVRVSWGSLVVCEGFIKEFAPGIEGATALGAYEVEWSMTIEVDVYPHLLKRKPVGKPKKPADYTNAIKSALLQAQAGLASVTFNGNILDALALAFDTVTGFIDDLASVTDGLQELKNGTLSQLNRIRGAAANVIRAGRALREFIESIPVEATQIADRFNELDAMTQTPSTTYQLQQMLKETRDADGAAQRAIVGRTRTTYVAKPGDTWESISAKFYGGPGRAGDIRDANLIGPGEQPKAGQVYLIPE